MDRKNSIKVNKKGTLKPQRATETATQRQICGNHYKEFKIQPIEFITKNKLNFIQGNIIKYVCRFDKKNGNEDIDKAIHYCELLKEIK